DNTLIVVEHDEDTMLEADWLIDIGPGAGEHGGEIVADGTPEHVMTVKESLTGQYLAGEQFIPLPSERRKPSDKQVKIQGAKEKPGAHRKISGLEHIEKVVDIDQSPIGRTPRSNPATYTGVFDDIREVFASTNEAKVRGYKKGRFSFNVKGGRCEACRGDGI